MAAEPMAAEAMQSGVGARQLGLYEAEVARARAPRPATTMCAGCRAREARYGFRDEDHVERPRTLCFWCFRIELTRRQQVAAILARGWNAQQVELPLSELLEDTHRRRRRAQIAARHALDI